jgi:hypothetical protein
LVSRLSSDKRLISWIVDPWASPQAFSSVALQRAVDCARFVRGGRGVSAKPDRATTRHTDFAVEVQRDCLHKRKATPADIFEMIRIDRGARVMRSYLAVLP